MAHDMQCLKNYRQTPLLLIFVKILNRSMHDEMFQFSMKNKSIVQSQLDFKSGQFFIKQLVAMAHRIYHLFDEGFETQRVFIDRSEASYEVLL